MSAIAWGARIPGWGDAALRWGVMVLVACALATGPWWLMLKWVRRRGYPTDHVRPIFVLWRRRLIVAMLAAALLVTLRPTMFVFFWMSRPSLTRIAKTIDAQPFSRSPPYVGLWRGFYSIGNTRRCPHGVTLMVTRDSDDVDSGPGFVYQPQAAECSRFKLGMPLGGGWYASE